MRIGTIVASGALCVAAWATIVGGIMPAHAQHHAHCGNPGCQYAAGGACIPNRTNFGYYQGRWRRWPGVVEADALAAEAARPAAPPADLPAVEVPAPKDEAAGGPGPAPANPGPSADGVDFSPTAEPATQPLDRGVDPPPLPPRDPGDAVPSLPPGLMQRSSSRRVPEVIKLWPNLDREKPILSEEPAVETPHQDIRQDRLSEDGIPRVKQVVAFGDMPGGLRVNPLRMRSEQQAKSSQAEEPPPEKGAAVSEGPMAVADLQIEDIDSQEKRYLVAPRLGRESDEVHDAAGSGMNKPATVGPQLEPRPLESPVKKLIEIDTDSTATAGKHPGPVPSAAANVPSDTEQRPEGSISRQNPLRAAKVAPAATTPVASHMANASRPPVEKPSNANTGGMLTSFELPARQDHRNEESRRFRVRIAPQHSREDAPTSASEPTAGEDLEISSHNPLRSR